MFTKWFKKKQKRVDLSSVADLMTMKGLARVLVKLDVVEMEAFPVPQWERERQHQKAMDAWFKMAVDEIKKNGSYTMKDPF